MEKKLFSKIIKNSIFFILLIILTFYLILRETNIINLINIIRSANITYILLGIFTMFIFFIIESYNVQNILNTLGENISLIKTIKFTLICFFFNGVTPASSGGQPLEIYFMTKENIKSSNAILALLIQSCSFLLSTVLLGITCAIFNYKVFYTRFLLLFLLGISIGVIGLLVMLLCIFSPKLMKKIVKIIVKLIKIISFNKIILNKDKINKTINNYSNSSYYIKSHISIFINTIIRTTIQASLYYLIPFLVFKSFNLSGYSIIKIFSMQAILYSTSSCLPLPGAIGISEAVYLKLFKPIFGSIYLNSAMLLSRGISFYWFVLVGLVVLIINTIFKKSNN